MGSETEPTLTLAEVSERCAAETALVIELVEYGVVEPSGAQPEAWRFPLARLERLQAALRLTRDLEVNAAGAALALELIDEIGELRARTRLLERLLESS